jgi:hypothetical protein
MVIGMSVYVHGYFPFFRRHAIVISLLREQMKPVKDLTNGVLPSMRAFLLSIVIGARVSFQKNSVPAITVHGGVCCRHEEKMREHLFL